MNPVVCNLCDTKLSYKRDLPKHQTTERCKSINKFINDKINIHIIEKMELQNKKSGKKAPVKKVPVANV